jgi:hypothetical protein
VQVGSGLIGQNGATFKVQLDFPELLETSPVAGAVSCFKLMEPSPVVALALPIASVVDGAPFIVQLDCPWSHSAEVDRRYQPSADFSRVNSQGAI